MVDLGVFNSVINAKDKYEEAERLCIGEDIQAQGGDKRRKQESDRGACGRDMPANLNLWLSVASEVPVGDNVTKLEKQAKRKSAEHEGN